MHRATARRFAHVCVALLLAALAVVAGSAPALAHASVVSTTPADQRILGTAPERVSLTFSEPVSLGLARVDVIGPDGDKLATGRPTHPAGKPESVAVTLKDTPTEGTHTVTWHAVSADSHPVQGAFTFSVGRATPAAAPAPSATEPGALAVAVHHVARWGSFAGFAVLLGTAFFVTACWPVGIRRRAVRRLLWTGWSSLTAATVLSFLVYGPYAVGTSASSFLDWRLLAATLDSRMGEMLMLRVAQLALVAVVLVLCHRRVAVDERRLAPEPSRRGRRRIAIAVLAAGSTLALTWSLASHSAAGPSAVLAVPADTVHLVAMALWIGGLVVLGAALLRSADVPGLEPALVRFSRVAQICVALLVATGVLQAWQQVGSVAALLGTGYGRVLIGKLCLVAVLLALGAVARGWVRRLYGPEPADLQGRGEPGRRGPDDSRIRGLARLVMAETLVAALVLSLSAVLVNTAPATAGEAATAGQAGRPVTGAAPNSPLTPLPFSRAVAFDSGGERGKGILAVVVSPATTGANEVHISLRDPRGRPRSVPEVRAQFILVKPSVGPIPVPLTSAGPGHFISSAVSLPVRGRWQLSLTVRTSEVDQDVVNIPVDVR